MMEGNGPSLKTAGMVLLFLLPLVIWTPPALAGEDIGAPNLLQAQDINATFDPYSESTTITWRNINYTGDSTLLEALWDVQYHVYRLDQTLNAGNFAEGTFIGTIDACDESLSGNSNDCLGTEGRHIGHSITYQIPPGVNGSFYYGIVSEMGDGSLSDSLDFYASSMFEPVVEITTPIRSPYYLQAEYLASAAVTRLTWVNYNIINPVLPEIGDDAFQIHVWRSTDPITRSNGLTMLSENTPIATLLPNASSYDVQIPISTTRTSYYAITYLLPNWTSEGVDYEDVRFLSGNSLPNYLFEDTIPPPAPTNVGATFIANEIDGTGNTTISWSELNQESGESYNIWMAGVPFADTNRLDIELIATVSEGTNSYSYIVERGRLGYTYYCIEAVDQHGIHSLTIGCASQVYEDAFTPWIAEPTNVAAEYLGDAKTRVTWTDQIGAEGETYHIWWSDQRIIGSQFIENQSIYWVGSVPDGFGEAIVDVPLGITRTSSYYYVTSEARYTHLNGTFMYTQLVQNVADHIVEDTLKPDDSRITEVTMVGMTKQVIVRWINDADETDETYHLYRHQGEPFAGGDETTSNLEEDAGWELVQENMTASDDSVSVMATTVNIDDGVSEEAWYAVVVEDEWHNLNPIIIAGLGGNALQVHEDTIPPVINVTVDTMASGTILDGDHRIIIQTNEELSSEPVINVTSANGQAYTIGEEPASMLSDNLADPSVGPTYYYDFSIANTDGHGELFIRILISDSKYNSKEYNLSSWMIDSVSPTISIYTPGSASESKYMYGSDIHVHGSAIDDVGIAELQIKFTYNYRQPNQATSPWMNFDPSQTTWYNESVAFTYTVSAADFQPGEHRVELKVIDSGGNERQSGVTFLVDSCHHTVNGTTICAYEQALKPDPEPIVEEVGLSDPPYIYVFGLAGLNVLAFMLTLIVIAVSISGGRRGDDDEDEGDDWMKEFIGTSVEPDMDEITGGVPEQKAMPDIEEEDDDEDDPFAVNKLQRKSRRRKKGDDDDDDKQGRRVVKRK